MPKKAPQYIRVRSVAGLRQQLARGQNEYTISLAGGLVRSSKRIELTTRNRFWVMHEVDGSVHVVTEKGLAKHTNIIEAMRKGAFFAWPLAERHVCTFNACKNLAGIDGDICNKHYKQGINK